MMVREKIYNPIGLSLLGCVLYKQTIHHAVEIKLLVGKEPHINVRNRDINDKLIILSQGCP